MLPRPGLIKALLALAVALSLAGCAGADKKAEGPVYQQARSLPPLEVPPELAAPQGDDSYAIPSLEGRVSARALEGRPSTPAARESGVLPEFDDIKVHRDGDMRWLEVKAAPEALWPRLRAFWAAQGLNLTEDDPRIGLMQTAWAENRVGVTASSWRRLLGKIYDAGVRDRYRLRVERMGAGRSAVFLTHQGAREVAADEDIVKWELSPPDPELEAVMLTRLMVFLGMNESQAKRSLEQAPSEAVPVALIEQDGQPVLRVTDEFDRTWRRTGVALDRAGLPVEDQDRSAGLYYVTAREEGAKKAGFLSRLFGAGDRIEQGGRYRLQLTRAGEAVELRALGPDGERLPAEQAREILGRLETQLK